MTAQAHRINIEAGQQSVFEALSTAEGWSRWFTPEVTGDFTDGSQVVCRLNDRSPIRLRVTSVQPGSAIAFELLEGPFAAPGAMTSIQLAGVDDGRTAVALRHDTPPIPEEEVERVLQGAFGRVPVAEPVPGDRLQRVRRNHPEAQGGLNGAAQHRGELGKRGIRLAFREQQRRDGDPDLRIVAVGPGKPFQDLPSTLGLAETHQRVHLPCPCPVKEVLR